MQNLIFNASNLLQQNLIFDASNLLQHNLILDASNLLQQMTPRVLSKKRKDISHYLLEIRLGKIYNSVVSKS